MWHNRRWQYRRQRRPVKSPKTIDVCEFSPCNGFVFIFCRLFFRTSHNDVCACCQLLLCFYYMGFRYYFAFIFDSFPKKALRLTTFISISFVCWCLSLNKNMNCYFFFFSCSSLGCFFFFFFSVVFCSFRFCLFNLLWLLDVLVIVWRTLIVLCEPIHLVTMAERFVSANVN